MRYPAATRSGGKVCPSCGETGPHYVPPSFGDPGFYMCTEILVRQGNVIKAVKKEGGVDGN